MAFAREHMPTFNTTILDFFFFERKKMRKKSSADWMRICKVPIKFSSIRVLFSSLSGIRVVLFLRRVIGFASTVRQQRRWMESTQHIQTIDFLSLGLDEAAWWASCLPGCNQTTKPNRLKLA
jgi:hypothetical protein